MNLRRGLARAPEWPIRLRAAWLAVGTPCLAMALCASGPSQSGALSSHSVGTGALSITIDGQTERLIVTCARDGDLLSASGASNELTATVTVTGADSSSVTLVRIDGSGIRSVLQAVNGLLDAAGHTHGQLTLAVHDHTYDGKGTFVVTTVDSKGARVRRDDSATAAGRFTLTCSRSDTQARR